MINGPNPKKRKDLTIKDHSSESKAFSKSIKSNSPGMFFSAAYVLDDAIYKPDVLSNKSALHEPCLIVVDKTGEY